MQWGGSISAKFNEAAFGTNNEAASITDSEWINSTTVSGSGSDTDRDTVIRGRYRHRRNLNEMTLQCYSKREFTASSGIFSNTSRVYLVVYDIENGTKLDEDFTTVEWSTYQEFNLTLDLSSTGANLTAGNYYVVEVQTFVDIAGDSGNAGSDSGTIKTYLREDYFIDVGTGV